MRLILGGFAQGKTTYAGRKYPESPVLDDFHLWFRRKLQNGEEPEEEIRRMLEKDHSLVIISDEIGSGVVPVSPEDRDYRERLGRCLCGLAREAESVERVFCGLGQRIK